MITAAPHGYTAVAATPEEIAIWRTKNPNRPQPSTRRLRCDSCGHRIWGSGLGIGSHNRSKKCAAIQAAPNAQRVAAVEQPRIAWDRTSSPLKANVHRAYRRYDTIECSCVEFGRDHVAPLEIYGVLSN